MNFNVGFATDIGRKRQQNQDNGAAFPDLGLFVVADGMGGHRGGETASAMVVDIVPQMVRHWQKRDDWEPKHVMKQAVQEANEQIYLRALKQPALQGMGTTTTALLFKDDKLVIGQVGDSRCYYFRPNAVWQVTRDHSLVQEKLRAGLITRDQLRTDRMKNVITRSVGFEQNVDVETFEMTVAPGDVFLVCSDGLSGLMEDPEMLAVMQKELFETGDIKRSVNELVALANQNGGDDNITVIVIQVTGH